MSTIFRTEQNRTLILDLLKVLLAFEVVCSHFGESLQNGNIVLRGIWSFRICAVPCFMFMAFYFTGQSFLKFDYQKIRLRIARLLVPFLFWGVMAFCINLVFHYCDTDITNLLWQIITGHSCLNPPLWYTMSLLILTILFVIIFSCKRMEAIFITSILFCVSFLMQYLKISSRMFSGLPYELVYPLGRIFEMMPYAALGILFRCFRFEENLSKSNLKTKLIVLVIVFFIVMVASCVRVKYGDINDFGYSGVTLLILAVCTVIGLRVLSSSIKCGKKYASLVNGFTRYTMGIYYIHYPVGKVLQLLCAKMNIVPSGIIFCVIVYLICYFMCFLIDKVFKGYGKLLVA